MQLLNERERKILDILTDDPHIGVNEMSRLLDVSAVTVRSAFDDLAEKGYLIRTRGAALPAFHPGILARQKIRPKVKSVIAKTAASLIGDGESIMIEAGTTTSLIARYLLGKRDIKVVTDSTLLIPYARSNPSIQLSFVGGLFQPESESMMGPIAVAQLREFHVKTAFIGTDGFSEENGLTTHLMEATEVVRTMHERSDTTVLLADSTKWNQAGFARIIPMDAIDILITDSEFPAEARMKIKEMGIRLLIAEE